MNFVMRLINKEPLPPQHDSAEMFDSICHKWEIEAHDIILRYSVNTSVKRRLIEHAALLADRIKQAKQYRFAIFFNAEESVSVAEIEVVFYISQMPIGSNTTEKIKKEFYPIAKDLVVYLKRDL